MSFTVYAGRYPNGGADEELPPDDYEYPRLGARDEVIARIREIVPFADFTDSDPIKVAVDPMWVDILPIGDDDAIDMIEFEASGDEEAVALVAEVMIAFELQGHTDIGEFFNPRTDVLPSYTEKWRSLRARLLAGSS